MPRELVYGLRIHRLTFLTLTLLPLASLACASSRAPTRTELSPGVVFDHSIAEGHNDGFEPAPRSPSSADPPATVVAEPSSSSAPSPSSSSASAPAPSANTPLPSASAAPAAPGGGPPDPDPMALVDQWQYEVAFDAGKLTVLSTTARHFTKPVVSARRLGRFAIELWIGKELLERVRFDFPGLGLQAPQGESGSRRPLYPPTSYTQGIHARQTVLIPAAPRARRAVLLDRATGEAHPLPWPPDHPLPEPAATEP